MNSEHFIKKYKLVYFIPVLFTLPLLNSLRNQDINLLTEKDNAPLVAYSDTSVVNGVSDSGNSIVTELRKEGESIFFSYQLGTNFTDRYAGFYFDFSADSTMLDISKYTYMVFDIEPGNSKALQPTLMTVQRGITRSDDQMTYRFLTYELDLLPGITRYKIRISDFKTPMWWHEMLGTSETGVGPADLKNIAFIKMESGTISPVNIPQSIIFKAVTFKKDRTVAVIITVIAIALYFFVFWIFSQMKKRLSKTVIIPYEKIEAASHGDRELAMVIEIIARDYKKSELTINDISEKTGLTTVKISTLLQDTFNTHFKLYLNSIRIEEAKRLIRETDRQMSEIAYMVGYKSPTHFNRVFREFNKMTPKEYRQGANS